MFLKLRMFTSHLLTAQDLVQAALRTDALNGLKRLDKETDATDNPSAQILRMLLMVMFHCPIPTTPAAPPEDEMARTPPKGDRARLTREFRALMENLHEQEAWQERLDRLECPSCRSIPTEAIITSCKHMYCDECFHQLPDEEGQLGMESKICHSCVEPIAEAAQCGVFDSVHPEEYESSTSAGSPSPGKRKRQEKAKKSKATKRAKRRPKRMGATAMFAKYRYHADDTDDENGSEDSDDEDWIPVIGAKTPGAKLTKIREIMVDWIQKDESVKIVLFTQFLDTIRLLKSMCCLSGWGYTSVSTHSCHSLVASMLTLQSKISGKMTPVARDQNIAKFREDKEIKVMISSLKTGGVGLDFSVANKCILMDLWWNEAIQEQVIAAQ